ncbi:hypothetical protein, variant [Aphanomyces invadans]|uniref:CW-type domain-containing protein n=1 Tax=Aphanomyces invadans TaxID=157072 RepID=A0A024U8R3_9STRA|nr:hypothetical protein, variant [Aphanomyces invadans]ETW01978.1 hypothetical protein, variant [Aphanomyces invadans]|eukprot:XP_008869826.1 hypothetical protein, variant [Aphanomyces invadans]
MYRIRIRSTAGGAAVLEVDPACSFLEFQDRGGFPPKQIEAAADEPIRSIFHSSDTVVLEHLAPTSTRPRRQTKSKRTFAGVGVKLGTCASEPNMTPSSAEPAQPTSKKAAVISVPNRKRFHGTGIALNHSSTDVPASSPPVSIGGSSVDSTSGKRRRKIAAIHLGSKADVETTLVDAVSGSGHSTRDKFLRKATKQAVVHQYDMTLANARLSAAWSNKFSIQVLSHGRMRVRFLAGVRTWKEEDVDCLQPTELRTALKYVVLAGGGEKEMLKPFNMAQVSPRVFWSLARLYNGDVGLGLQTLLPEEDWAFLDTRTRVLSAKALEAQATGGGRWRREDPAPAMEPVPALPIDLTTASPDNGEGKIIAENVIDPRVMRNAVARAAMARLQLAANSTRDESALSTTLSHPVHAARDGGRRSSSTNCENDMDDVLTVVCDACGKARVVRQLDAARSGIVSAEGGADVHDQQPWTCLQLWNRVGGCTLVDDEVLRVVQDDATVAQNLDAVGIKCRTDLANAESEALFSAWRRAFPSCAITLDSLDGFVQEARRQELDECMHQQIVQDASDRVLPALEAVKLATPHDLVATPADLIVRDLVPWVPEVNQVIVEAWKQHARDAMERTPWMAEWRSV